MPTIPETPAVDPPAGAGPILDGESLVLSLADPDRDLAEVRVYQELRRPRDLPATWRDGSWQLTLPRPDHGRQPVLRMEYAFVVQHPDGHTFFATDPANPDIAEGPFGPKSVVRFPGYAEPDWLTMPVAAGAITRLTVPLPRLRTGLEVHLWQPPDASAAEELPLLLVHDGPEYHRFAALTRLLAVLVADGLPSFRAALLAPVSGQRDATYAAAAAYADAMAFTLLPWLARAAPQPEDRLPVAMGASLGALAALHAASRHPWRLAGLLLQSGSYFRLRTDGHERGFAHFDRVSRFVGNMLRATPTSRPMPIAMTCGAAEENLANNRHMAAALDAKGHDVSLLVNPDGHTFTGWRDALDPVLGDLLQRCWADNTGATELGR